MVTVLPETFAIEPVMRTPKPLPPPLPPPNPLPPPLPPPNPPEDASRAKVERSEDAPVAELLVAE